MILKCNLSSYFAASYGSNPICKGCLSCSKDNGCIRCQHKLFFFLRREGMRQYGECLHSCPSGYYGLRTPDMNRCSSELRGFFCLFCWCFWKLTCSFYWEAIIHTLFLRRYVVEHNIFIEVVIFIKTDLLMSELTPGSVMFSKLNSCCVNLAVIVIASFILIKRKVRKELWFKQLFLVLKK